MSVPSLSAEAGGVGLGGPTPIVGERDLSTGIGATADMVSGDLSPLDAGDVSGLAGASFELWFQCPNGVPSLSSQLLLRGPEVSAGVRQYTVAVSSTAFPTVTVRHATSGAITATSGSAITAATWYHMVAVVLGSNLILYVNGAAVATTAWPAGVVATASYTAGVSQMIVGGFDPQNWYGANIAVYNYGLSAARVAAHYQAGTQRGFPVQATGTRIGAVLDAAGSDAPRSIGAGARSVTPTYMRGQTPKDACEEALSAEAVDAALFISASGAVTYLDSAHRSSSPYNTSQATFGDAAGELAYVDVNVDYSESFLANEINVTRDGSTADVGATQTVSDATSISRYFKRSQSITSLPVVDDAAALTVATAYLAKYKDPQYRITSLSFSTLDPSVAEAIFRREIGDKITVLRTPPGGGARITQVLWIQKIEVSATNDGTPAMVRWGVSPV